MNTANPLVAGIETERHHMQKARRDNADLRGMVALHEAAHAAVSYSYVPWGQIVIPFNDPKAGKSFDSCLSDDENAETFFAGVAIDRVTFGHGLLAQGDFYPGLQLLVRTYGHVVGLAKAQGLMDQAERKVLALLPNIQALAVQAMQKGRLISGDFLKAARRAGLHSKGERARKPPAKALDLSQFAQTPEQLRAEVGQETLDAVQERLRAVWTRADPTIVRVPPCRCGPMKEPCGKQLVDDYTAHAALIHGWSIVLPYRERAMP